MKRSVIGAILLTLACSCARAALSEPRAEAGNGEFQYSHTFDNEGVDGKPAHSVTAYLWIPPSATKLRGVILTQQNVGEQPFVEHPVIREVCAKNDLAIAWHCAPIDLRFERDKALGLRENSLCEQGAKSGFSEIGSVPWFTFGHSSTVTFARVVAEVRPERTIAILSAKGGIMLPVSGSVPGAYSGGQFPEWRQPTHDWTKHGMSLPGLAKTKATSLIYGGRCPPHRSVSIWQVNAAPVVRGVALPTKRSETKMLPYSRNFTSRIVSAAS